LSWIEDAVAGWPSAAFSVPQLPFPPPPAVPLPPVKTWNSHRE
jgi:hypothetical protein